MQSNIKINTNFKCIIGLLDFERHKKQKISLKIKASSNEFLDYAKLCKKAKKFIKKSKFFTLEEAIKKLIVYLKEEFQHIKKIKIQITKLQIINNTKVSVFFKEKY